MTDCCHIKTGGSLFLDRDGVLNKIGDGEFVTSPDQLEMIDGAAEAVALCNRFFKYVFVVTNQQCVGEGLLSSETLDSIHIKIMNAVEAAGGHIDHIYACTDVKEDYSLDRKPNIGMALRARRDFPGVKLRNSVMVGDSYIDMLFGRRSKMQTVLIGSKSNVAELNPHIVHFRYPTLLEFAKSLSNE